MSVWFTESFRGQALWDFNRTTSLSNSDWENFATRCDIWFDGGVLKATGEFDEVVYPSGTCEEILASKQRAEFLRIFRGEKRVGKNGAISKMLLKQNVKYLCGLNAVYKTFNLIRSVHKSTTTLANPQGFTWIKNFITHSLISTAYSMRSQPKVLERVVARIDWRRVQSAEKWLHLANSARNLITLRWMRSVMRSATGETPAKNLAESGKLFFPDDWTIYVDGWMTYIRAPEMDDKEFLTLTTVDIDRLQQMLVSMAMLDLYHATYKMTAGNETAVENFSVLRKQMETILFSALEKCDERSAQTICRDLKKGFGIYLSKAAGRLSEQGTHELLEEFKTSGYGKTYNFSRYMDALAAAPFDVAQDLGRLYKILPAPDYDIGQSFVARQKEHLNPHPITETFDDNPCNLEEFRKYQRKVMIITLTLLSKGRGLGRLKDAVQPLWWADYQQSGQIPRGLDWVDSIDLTGTARYVERHADSAVAYKDTVACEEDLREAMDDMPMANYKRNMLLRYLFDPACPTPESARARLVRKDHVHRVGFKMEAHKTEARLFFIGNMSDRIVQSEMEENTHRLGVLTPGYMIGQTTEYTVGKIMRMVAPQILANERVYYLNFDLKRWSPGMPSEVQRLTHSIFAEVFQRDEYLHATKINENSIVILNKRGYVGQYRNPGANFEGYNGKEMTWMHCSLMGYAVYRYKRETRHDISIELCAFIDDGLATFKDTMEHGPDRFMKFVEVVRATYAALGFVLEISKCYLSDVFAIFLNEIYYKGKHITYGLRAAMRIGTTMPEPTDTIIDELNARAAGCQGAMKSGMDMISAYTMFLWAGAHILRNHRYNTVMDPKAAALHFYTPKALLGLQQPNLIAISSNMASDGLAEGISTIQLMAKVYPAYTPAVIKLLRMDIAIKSDESLLIAPRTVRAVKASIVETRLKQIVAKTLKTAQLAARARSLISLGERFDMGALARAVVSPNTILVESLMTDIKEATPYSVVMALVNKFESSKTIQTIVGRSAMRYVARENRRDIVDVATAFKRTLM